MDAKETTDALGRAILAIGHGDSTTALRQIGMAVAQINGFNNKNIEHEKLAVEATEATRVFQLQPRISAMRDFIFKIAINNKSCDRVTEVNTEIEIDEIARCALLGGYKFDPVSFERRLAEDRDEYYKD